MIDRLVRLVPLILTVAITAVSLEEVRAAEVSLPDRAPLPVARPGSSSEEDSGLSSPTAGNVPIPIPRPRPSAGPSRDNKPSAPDKDASPVPPIEGQPMADAERACRAALHGLEVSFEGRPSEGEPEGCILAHPVLVTALSPTIDLKPEALLKCAMAETTARFIRDVVADAAKKHLGSPLRAIRHASAYVCRPRNGSSKLSEHAFGNALDFSAFELVDGRVVEVGTKPDAAEQKFLDAIRKAACGPFKTVLGPGSDADHSNHFHFDLAPRRPGSTFCQ